MPPRHRVTFWFLFSASGVVTVGVGLLLVFYVATGGRGGSAEWGPLEQTLAVGLGLVVSILGVVVGSMLVRQNVFGQPHITIASGGIQIGLCDIGWGEIDSAAGVQLVGIPYLAVRVTEAAFARLPFLERIPSMKKEPNARVILVAEAQLGLDIAEAEALIASMRAPVAHVLGTPDG